MLNDVVKIAPIILDLSLKFTLTKTNEKCYLSKEKKRLKEENDDAFEVKSGKNKTQERKNENAKNKRTLKKAIKK